VFVGVARFDLRVHDARSLKDKRAVVRSLTSLIKGKFDCAVAEVDFQDKWQRSAIGVSVISSERFHAEKMLREIQRHVESHPGAELLQADIDVLRPGD
jgi:uncharacterized protein